ncbi:MAG: heme exporter protein CcmD [Proteobacteria bacterium]|nr:heme exporter protein CcmD [Pseudomonadota bacterium]
MSQLFGKYAAYVVPAYILSAVCILAAIVVVMRAYRAAKARLAALESAKIDGPP